MLGSHDETRVAARLNPARARAAMAILLTLPATPVIYYGDELGMTGAKIAPQEALDPWAKQRPDGSLGRDPQRSPVQWTSGENAGFCPPGVTPWLPAGDDTSTANVAAQHSDPGPMLSLTRRLLALRARHPALRAGRFVLRHDMPHGVLANERLHAGGRVLVAVNFTSAPAAVPPGEAAGLLITTSITGPPPGRAEGRLRLSADEAILLATRRSVS